MQLPWQPHNVPHGLLDILRGCNIKCAACYNTEPNKLKRLEEIEDELNLMSGLRKLNSVSLVGGEPTLHPQLLEIIRMIRHRGLHTELFSNGVLVDDQAARSFKEAGVSIMMFHIENGQVRHDLPANYTAPDLWNLRRAKLALAASHNLDPGLTLTAHLETPEEIDEIVTFFINDPHALYLLVTLYHDITAIESIHGDLHAGMQGTLTNPQVAQNNWNMAMIQQRMAKLGLSPFAYLGSNVNKTSPRWLSYLVAATHDPNGGDADWLDLTPSYMEPAFLRLHHLVMRRFPFYQEQHPDRLRQQIVLNGLLGGRRAKNAAFLARIRGKEARLMAKRIVFQRPASVLQDGTVEHCRNCPDAVIKNRRLVPVCISDRVSVSSAGIRFSSTGDPS